ncbi:GIY-YIG nuclease family protein [Candidatus Pacearchaeota archaeon]|nr:GIY-YIG nuclease family protein [Candidatus Pacearchaeota archaeon]
MSDKEFYFQIKGKDTTDYAMSQWAFPPLFSGKVEAVDRKEARKKVEEEYGRAFPLRVLKKDAEKEHYLLNITEIKPDGHIARLFEDRECTHCEKPYCIIDKYNAGGTGGPMFCSQECKDEHYRTKAIIMSEFGTRSQPCIYKITHKMTGLSYVGKTTQAFTLRWWQHVKSQDGTKFHKAIQESCLTEWLFEIIEIVRLPEGTKLISEIEQILSKREMDWIRTLDSVKNGYNTMGEQG